MSRKRAEHSLMAAEPTVEGTAVEHTAAVSEPAAATRTEAASAARTESREPGEEAVEKKYVPEPNPFQRAHNNVAGVAFLTRREPYQAELAFKDKPSQAVIDYLKDSGFKWDRYGKIWTRPIDYDTQSQDRLVASRTYHKAVGMILEEKGLVAEPEKTPF